jgi:hypothetical protein
MHACCCHDPGRIDEPVRSYCCAEFGLPHTGGGSAPTLDAHDGEANLGLANLLVKQGKVREAQGYYETAAKSPDPQVRSAALAALKQ